jgi:hypothetical protein
MTSCRKKIETALIAAAVGRAFKASKKEALEELAFWKHRRAQAKGSPLQRRMEPLLVQLSPITADDSTDFDRPCLIHDSTFEQRTPALRLSGGGQQRRRNQGTAGDHQLGAKDPAAELAAVANS